MPDTTVSIIGLGWLGLPLAKRLQEIGYQAKGSTTTVEKVDNLNSTPIEVHQLRLNPEPAGNLAALLQAKTIVINIPPKAGKMGDAFHPKQIRHLTDAICQSAVEHVIYVSSTSVYPEISRMVEEPDVTIPDQSPSPALVEAEQLVQQLGCTTTIVRCGGLMGYDRIPGKYIAGRRVDSGDVPVNYLHRDDAVAILSDIIQQRMGGVFNAVAPGHPPRKAIYKKSCEDFGYELPQFVEPDEPIPYKVVSVDKLLQATRYVFTYPDPLHFFYQL